ncbi:MAG: hypothetical protein ACI4RT_05650 [Candidatus Spyradenecus sp.]
MNKLPLLATLALAALLTAGCAFKPGQPVFEPTTAITLPGATTDSLHQTLVTAIKTTPWTIISDNPGEITVRLVRGHGPRSVTAKIAYTATNYTITLVDAVDMDYDPEAKTISRKYNQWIRNLDQRIARSLQ